MVEETEYDEMMLSNVITPMTRSVTLLTLQIMSLSKKKNARKTSDNNTHVLQNMRKLLLKLYKCAELQMLRTLISIDH